ncbi:hypothetical protein SBRY_70279 [Actinacidiphila bryophytorum]|uniref:Uncharacterized protein n=1 Tax=Actinacidiphila bryophytorum TaxID=1436133 RepID=A0A9W4H6J7_9ACTN|nr:hypothetical protein SBRY_70279 [Actinacidiphila bryophytorum]
MDRPAADHRQAGHRGDGPADGAAAAARPRIGVRPGRPARAVLDHHPHPAGGPRLRVSGAGPAAPAAVRLVRRDRAPRAMIGG